MNKDPWSWVPWSIVNLDALTPEDLKRPIIEPPTTPISEIPQETGFNPKEEQ
jgi:hypothetical protein